jgi:hypothetical protein
MYSGVHLAVRLRERLRYAGVKYGYITVVNLIISGSVEAVCAWNSLALSTFNAISRTACLSSRNMPALTLDESVLKALDMYL